jgi:hypothetical protein
MGAMLEWKTARHSPAGNTAHLMLLSDSAAAAAWNERLFAATDADCRRPALELCGFVLIGNGQLGHGSRDFRHPALR